MNRYVRQMVSDSKGSVSHKRVITVSAAFLLFATFTINMFHKLNLEEYMWDTFKWIILGGMGISTTEFFSKSGSGPNPLVDAETEEHTKEIEAGKSADPAKPVVFTPDSDKPSK